MKLASRAVDRQADAGLAAADEVDNFVAIIRLDFGSRPLVAWKNLEITLDRNAP